MSASGAKGKALWLFNILNLNTVVHLNFPMNQQSFNLKFSNKWDSIDDLLNWHLSSCKTKLAKENKCLTKCKGGLILSGAVTYNKRS